jgi:hypothetical protein
MPYTLDQGVHDMKRYIPFLITFLFFILITISATTLGEEEKACAVCGKTSTQTVVNSTNRFGYPDLDLRPPEMMRSTMPYWVQTCPHCGYCSADIAVLVGEAKEVVLSLVYQNQLANSQFVELANKFLCEAMIYGNAERFPDAAWAYLHAAWACDDKGQQKNAALCRVLSLEILFIIQDNGEKLFDEQGGLQLLIAELARRTEQFDLALEYIKKGLDLDVDEIIEKCLLFEKQLVENKDFRVHSLQEVLE